MEVNLARHWIEAIEEVFAVFDNENRGFIETKELALAFKCLRLKATEEELRKLVNFEGEKGFE